MSKLRSKLKEFVDFLAIFFFLLASLGEHHASLSGSDSQGWYEGVREVTSTLL